MGINMLKHVAIIQKYYRSKAMFSFTIKIPDGNSLTMISEFYNIWEGPLLFYRGNSYFVINRGN